MEAGRLRHSIQLQSPSESTDAYGEPTASWATYATVWAGIEPLTGREALIAAQINAELTHKITIRYKSDVKPHHRVVFAGRIFDINVIKNLMEKNVALELLATEKIVSAIFETALPAQAAGVCTVTDALV